MELPGNVNSSRLILIVWGLNYIQKVEKSGSSQWIYGNSNYNSPSEMAKKKKSIIPAWLQIAIVLIIIVGVPCSLVFYQSSKSGLSVSQVLSSISKKSSEKVEVTNSVGEIVDYPQFLFPQPIGDPITSKPLIANLAVVDMNGDGLDDIVVADIASNSISIILQSKTGPFQEIKIASDVLAPSHVQAFDFDKDGKLDILVSCLGMLFPNNDKIGSIIYLHNDGDLKFTKHVLIPKNLKSVA